MAAASLELFGISKRYPGVQALNGVDFECRPGEIHAVLGENGSGKSTLLGIAGGAVVADQGRVMIMGQPLAAADPLQARQLGLAVVYQDDLLVRELTVAKNLLLGAVDAPTTLGGKREWAQKQLAPYDLRISPDTLVGHLTASQRQFLEIVKALAANPKVLLLDEPTSSLDISGVETLGGIIRRIVAAGAAVVYVSHRLPEILALGRPVDHYPARRRISSRHLRSWRRAFGKRSHRADGRSPDRNGIPGRIGAGADRHSQSLSSTGLTGPRFQDVAFFVRRGEILGFAGSEGNGQREALRALGGFEAAGGQVLCGGRPVKPGTPRDALDAGVFSLSADRAAEFIFPGLACARI